MTEATLFDVLADSLVFASFLWSIALARRLRKQLLYALVAITGFWLVAFLYRDFVARPIFGLLPSQARLLYAGSIFGVLLVVQRLTIWWQRYEQELQESEQRLRQVLQSVPAILISSTKDGTVQVASLPDSLSTEAGQLARPWDWVEESHQVRFQQSFQAFCRDGTARLLEVPDRVGNWWRVKFVNLPAVNGPEVGIVATDITEEHLAEKDAATYRERLETLLDALQDVVWSFDLRTRNVVYVSPSVERTLGWTASDFYKDPELWRRIIHPEDAPKALKLVDEIASHKVLDTVTNQLRVRHKDGSFRWLEVRARIVLDEERKPLRLDGVATDISERKKVLEELEQHHEILSLVVAHAPLLLWVTDREGRLRFFAGKAAHKLGLEAGQVIGRPVQEVFQAVPAFAENTLKALSGELVHAEVTVGELTFSCWHYPQRDSEGQPRGVFTIALDMTDWKKAEEELRLKEAQLRQAQKMEAIARLAGGIAHDFNNVLTVILGFTEMAIASLPENSPLSQDLFQIQHAALQGAQLTKSLLSLSRPQPGKVVTVDVNAEIKTATRLYQKLLGEDIELEVPLTRQPLYVQVGEAELQQILLNLIVNARDAMPNGGRLTIVTRPKRLSEEEARAHQVRASEYVMICVEDTGVGMDEAILPRIFEPFFTTKPEGQGTGLGLSTVYGIVRQRGGFIQVQSAPAKGGVFEVYLPRVPYVLEAKEEGERVYVQQVPWKDLSVLVVEDEPSVGNFIERILQAQSTKVHLVSRPHEAIRMFSNIREAVNLVITDLVLPGMDGVILVERLRREKPDLPVIFISGYSDRPLIGRALRVPRSVFLTKPFSADELVAAVSRVAERSKK